MRLIINIKNTNSLVKISLFVGLILIETIIILFLLWLIFNKSNVVSISPIPKKYITHPQSDLNYYYEFVPNSKISDKQDWLNYTPVYTINSDGLNETTEYNVKKDQQTVRIVTLGDSHTFGYLVSTPNSYPKQLEKLLNSKNCNNQKFEVINLGMPGYDIEYSVERFKNKGQKYNPDIVLWFLKKDDFTELKEKTGPKITYYRDHPNLEELKDFTQKGYHYYEVYKANKDLIEELGITKILSLQNSYLNLFTNFYQGQLLLFSYDDSEINDYEKNIQNYVSSRPRTTFFKGIPPLYKSNNLHLQEGHPNKDGYKVIAEYLFDYLISQKIIKCQ